MPIVSIIKLFLAFILVMYLIGCETSKVNYNAEDIQKRIVSGVGLDELNDETYFFPALNDANENVYIPLQKWDIIFAGYYIDSNDTNVSNQIIAMLSPGKYTHALLYLGKDRNGYAYAAEMNVYPNVELQVGLSGVYVDGNLFIDCLGSDYEKANCPITDFGSENLFSHEYITAKRLSPNLREKIIQNEKKILEIIAEDAQDYYPFQVPLSVSYETIQTKEIILTNDGRTNGSYCAEYITLLFEEAGVCLEDIHMTPEDLFNYFVYDTPGKDYILPGAFNIESREDITTQDFFLTNDYTFVNAPARESLCYEGNVSYGVITPEYIFNSPSMEYIPQIDTR